MPVYRVYGKVVGSKYLGEYEAATADEAEDMAMEENGHCGLCHQCADECDDPEITDCTVEEVTPEPKAKRKRG